MSVHLAVRPAEFLPRPSAKARGFVIDENTPVPDFRLAGKISSGQDIRGSTLSRGHIRPPIPGGYAQLLRQLVNSVDRAPLVAPGYHQQPPAMIGRILRRSDHKAFPFASQVLHIQRSRLHQLSDLFAFTQCSHDDRNTFSNGGSTARKLRPYTGYAVNIVPEISNRAYNPRIVCCVVPDRRSDAPTGYHRKSIPGIGALGNDILSQNTGELGIGTSHDKGGDQ